MIHNESLFLVAGHSLFCQYWRPETAPKAVIIIAHGLAEHSGRYAHVADFFVNHNYAVCALDHIGHGKSEGNPGYVERFSDYTKGLECFIKEVKKEFTDVPLFLIGHSMGGAISAAYLCRHQETVKACILSGPAIIPSDMPSKILLFINRIISIFLPKLGMQELDSDGVSRDPNEVKKYLDDALVYNGKMSSRLVAELFYSMDYIKENAAKITLPLLILHGGDDRITAPEGSQLLHDLIASEDKKLIIYDGLYHEIFNEPERNDVFNTMLEWLDRLVE
jgi:alpha-beta hydrolase superfamily lysophospholipase